MDLKKGENESYNALGDAQGDATLEGAVYGLFAAEDLLHPDGKTGVVYRANHLVAVATTDKNGDASFLACTEAPGRTYDYSKGSIADAADGWRKKAPGNLYTQDAAIDDYTADKAGSGFIITIRQRMEMLDWTPASDGGILCQGIKPIRGL